MADGETSEPREPRISTAVNFLLNQKVKQSPLAQRRAFLEKKGLTREEIEIAVARSGSTDDVPVTQTDPTPLQPQPGAPHLGGQAVVPMPYYQQPAIPLSSTWGKFRDLVTFAVLVGGVGYSLYKLYQTFLKKYMFGREETLSKVDQTILELQENLAQTLTKVQESLTAIQDSLQQQDEKIHSLTLEAGSQKSRDSLSRVQDSQLVNELKTEVSSIKGLLLNRHQFPPTPNTPPVLPAWQMPVTPVSNLTKDAVSSPGDVSVSQGKEDTAQEVDEMTEEVRNDEKSLDQSSKPADELHLDSTGLNQITENGDADIARLNQNSKDLDSANHNLEVEVPSRASANENTGDEIVVEGEMSEEEAKLKLSNPDAIKSHLLSSTSLGNGILVEEDSTLEVEN